MRNFDLMKILIAGAASCFAISSTTASAQATVELQIQLERELAIAQKPIYDIGQRQGAGQIEIDAWVDRADLAYKVGQPLRVMVRPHQDAYVTVVDVGSSGRVAILFPNHFQQNSRVRAGSTVAIPAERARWQIKVDGPAGIDLVQVIASRRPLTLPELNQIVHATAANPTLSLGRSADDVARDLVSQLKPQAPSAGGGGSQRVGMRNVLFRILPTDAAAEPEAEHPTLPAPGAQGFPFELTIRPDRAAYRIGEPVHIGVSSKRDCHLTLIDVGAGGKAVQLFPNSLQRESLIRADERIVIPSPQSPFQFVARGPAGVDAILAICRADGVASQYPADPGQGDFVGLGTIQNIGRDLMVAGSPGQSQKVEHATASFVILE
jgi:hypothetical protein